MPSTIVIFIASEKEETFIQRVPFQTYGHTLRYVTTGVGSVHTMFEMLNVIKEKKHTPSFAIQLGIAGAFCPETKLGEVFLVEEESWGDFGVREDGKFCTIFDLGLDDANRFPYRDGRLFNAMALTFSKKTQLPLARAVTVNQITTASTSLNELTKKGFALESMEGAAFHYFCLKKSIPFLQLRAVSNRVGDRDKAQWDIEGALSQLVVGLERTLAHIP